MATIVASDKTALHERIAGGGNGFEQTDRFYQFADKALGSYLSRDSILRAHRNIAVRLDLSAESALSYPPSIRFSIPCPGRILWGHDQFLTRGGAHASTS